MNKASMEFEKIIDKIGNLYEAVVRMSVYAKKIANGEGEQELAPNDKVTVKSLEKYIEELKKEEAGKNK
jgi:DNA-directed RNA polymerase subunit K/omega